LADDDTVRALAVAMPDLIAPETVLPCISEAFRRLPLLPRMIELLREGVPVGADLPWRPNALSPEFARALLALAGSAQIE
jgi:hypothetical protein